MTLEEAEKLLKDEIVYEGLYGVGWYLSWVKGKKDACLDGYFTADELEAIAIYMRHVK